MILVLVVNGVLGLLLWNAFFAAFASALLAGAIWLLRRMAGRIFEIGMLMYGTEATLREMLRWAPAESGC